MVFAVPGNPPASPAGRGAPRSSGTRSWIGGAARSAGDPFPGGLGRGDGEEEEADRAGPRPRSVSISAGFARSVRPSSPVTRPRSRMRTRSDRAATKSKFCSTSRTESAERSCRPRRVSAISSMIEGWMPSVGSSSIRKSGSPIRHRASVRSCCSPPDSAPPLRSSRPARRGKAASTVSSTSSSCSPVRPCQPKRKLSRTVSCGKIPRSWGTKPMPRRARSNGGSAVIALPRYRMTPDVAGSKPMSSRSRVDFPMPLWPRIPTTSSSRTWRSTPCRMGTFP